LVCFCIEIALKTYSYGFKGYFKDWWYIIDAVVIIVSIAFLLIDLVLKLSNNAYYKVFSKIVRIMFRFLRLFLVYRKLVETKMVEQTHARNKAKSPIVRIVEIFNNISENLEDQEIISKLKWCK
jgi:cAMP-specific phosphodiesterase 4